MSETGHARGTSLPRPAHEEGFVEVGDRCWVARFDFLDVNVGLVGGERGLLVVDTLASTAAARALVEQARRLGAGDVVAVVNTHEHFDHVLGNATLLEEYGDLPVVAHEEALAGLERFAATRAEEERGMLEDIAAGRLDARYADCLESPLAPPTETFSSARVVDLGDRAVELVHPGRGHTEGDLVVRVPDADVLFAGDLVEESQRNGAVPGFGDDCFPLEWPATLDLALGLVSEESVVVPGHGLPVRRDFVEEQRSAIGVVAETIRDLATRGVPLDDALAAASWPYPAELLGAAVRRGYEQLPRSARRLPLV